MGIHKQTTYQANISTPYTSTTFTTLISYNMADNKNNEKTANDVVGRENKGMGMADKLAGAVKDPVNQALGGNNQKSKGEAASDNDTKGESIPGSSVPGKNY